MSERRWTWAVAAVLLAGAALRVAGMFDDFWLDEIWSWRIARAATGITDVLSTRVDNNHPLNTLILYWMGDVRSWPAYRVPAVFAGVLATIVPLWRLGRVEGICAAVLLGFSYPLVVYSSEARGYALMVLFSLVGFAAMQRYLIRPSWPAAAAFGAAVVLGLVSHLTFLHFYLAALAWSAVALLNQPRPVVAKAKDFARCHTVPVLFAGWWYFFFVSRMTIGGAQDTSSFAAITGALSVMGGGTPDGRIVAAVVGAALAASLGIIWARRREMFPFYLTCVVLSPAFFVALQAISSRGTETLFPRYFLVSMVFGYLLLAEAMGAAWHRHGGRVGVVVLLACFAAGSLYQTSAFLRGTRGHYADAVAYMVDHSAGGVATVGSDNTFRGGTLLGFYARYAPAGGRVEFHEAGGELPEWFLVNATQAGATPAGPVVVGGVPYRFEREFTHRGLSGWSWYLFRRAEPRREPGG